MIHLYEDDPRFINDPTFENNHGSFSVINYGLNNALKKIGKYSDVQEAEYIGFATSLNLNHYIEGKKSFYITVWETINKLTNYHLQIARGNKIIFGMSDQVSNLYRKEGIQCETLHCGCDTEFWKQTLPKNEKFTFIHINSSNVRSGLDLTLQAFDIAFRNNPDVQLIVKDTNTNIDILLSRINEMRSHGTNIEYITKRSTKQEVRDLYSQSHVGLNLLRMTSWGFPLHEMSACNCLCLTGDIAPTNVLIKQEYGVLLKPSNEINISDKLAELVNNWGLLNCYGGFPYSEEPRFYDFNVEEYAEKLKEIYNNWESYKKIDTRTPIVDNWKWETSAQKLISSLQSYEMVS
jgi:glycosyltransferase involved in cell wall biosynthesis